MPTTREEVVIPTVQEEVAVTKRSRPRARVRVRVRKRVVEREVPVVEESVVVEKCLVLCEEIRITKRRTEHKRRARVPARREEVTIERETSEQELRGRQR